MMPEIVYDGFHSLLRQFEEERATGKDVTLPAVPSVNDWITAHLNPITEQRWRSEFMPHVGTQWDGLSDVVDVHTVGITHTPISRGALTCL